MTQDPYRFTHPIRVRWGECDMQGIVFNPNYMVYVDVALTDYWRAIGMPYPQALAAEGTDSFMVAAAQSYRDAARFDDELTVALRCEYLGTTSFRLAFEIRREVTALCLGTATYVNGHQTTRRPTPLSARLIGAFTGYEHTPPERK